MYKISLIFWCATMHCMAADAWFPGIQNNEVIERWMGGILAEMGELKLAPAAADSVDLRVLYVPTFAHPICAHLSQASTGAAPILRVVKLDGQGGYQPHGV